MKVIGQILRSEREKRNVSLNEVAVATKVSVKILLAIEEGDIANLPQKTFLRGFVRSYAQYLKLDVAQIMEQFQNEMGSTNPKKPDLVGLTDKSPEPRGGDPKKTSGGRGSDSKSSRDTAESSAVSSAMRSPVLGKQAQPMTKVFIGVALVLIVIVSVILKKTVDKYEGESTPPHSNGAIAGLASTTTVPGAAPAVDPDLLSMSNGAPKSGDDSHMVDHAAPLDHPESGVPTKSPDLSNVASTSSTEPSKTLPVKTLVSSTTVKAVTTSTSTTIPAKLTTTTAAPKLTTVPTTTTPTTTIAKTTTTTPTTTIAKTTTTAPTTTTTTLKPNMTTPSTTKPDHAATPDAAVTVDKPQEVIIEALDNVTIQARTDGGKVSSVTLKAEDVYTFKAKGKISLDISDGGAINVVHNGKDKGVPGVLGQSIKLRFP